MARRGFEFVDKGFFMDCRSLGIVPAVLALSFVAPAAADEGGALRVMTQNMDEGTTFEELVGARTPQAFVAAVTQTYQNILATKPAERAAGIARQIAREHPDLVGLQEASIVRTGAVPPATTVESDLLQSLLDALTQLGEDYRVVAIVSGLDAEAPSTLGFDVRLTTQDAILVRGDRRSGRLQFDNVQVHHFLTNLTVPTPIGPITLPRGWASVDVKTGEIGFRFVTTHLDTVVQLAQMNELLASLANTQQPVVLSGDLNANAANASDPSFATYRAAVDAGFRDAWLLGHAPGAGFTCCQPDLFTAASSLSVRIDFVLFRGEARVSRISVVGDRPEDRTLSGLWPSDHAGVAATLSIER
jgi:endonuclease/exonuclease/phosphatase family metal-dependent hydrolase